MTSNFGIIAAAFLFYGIHANAQQQTHPRNIILMVGDGMGCAQIYAGLTANHGSLNLERCPVVGFHKNQSADQYITDSAAGATAFACGQKTYNGAIAVDVNRSPLTTILEVAEKHGLSTGLVVTCSVTHATPACFIAHQPSRSLDENIAADFLKTDIDVFIGGGRKFFVHRKDSLDLFDSLKSHHYQVVNSMDELAKVHHGKLAGFLADEQQPRFSQGRGDQLVKSTATALEILKQNPKGLFLMIEGSQIDWGGHADDAQYIIEEMLDFDRTIGVVLDFAAKDGNTLVVITADHETGGFSINGGDMKAGTVDGHFTTKDHTGVMIPVFAFGPGAERFAGIYENTAIFHKMMNAYRFQKP
jgi:alkaline phosphatase